MGDKIESRRRLLSRRNTRTGPMSLTIMLKDKNESYNIVVKRLHLLSILTFKTGRILICFRKHSASCVFLSKL